MGKAFNDHSVVKEKCTHTPDQSKNLQGDQMQPTVDSTVHSTELQSDSLQLKLDTVRQEIQKKLSKMNEVQLQQMLEISAANKIQLEKYRRIGSPLVQSRLDGLVLAGLLIVGIISDYYTTNDTRESFYFKLAIAIVVAVNQIDNCARLQSIETLCGSFLALDLIYSIVRDAIRVPGGMNLHEDFKLVYAVLVLPMMSKNISWGTALVYLIYLSFNLWMAGFYPAIFAVLIVFFYQRGRFEVSQENYERLYKLTGVIVLLVTFGYMYLTPKKFGAGVRS